MAPWGNKTFVLKAGQCLLALSGWCFLSKGSHKPPWLIQLFYLKCGRKHGVTFSIECHCGRESVGYFEIDAALQNMNTLPEGMVLSWSGWSNGIALFCRIFWVWIHLFSIICENNVYWSTTLVIDSRKRSMYRYDITIRLEISNWMYMKLHWILYFLLVTKIRSKAFNTPPTKRRSLPKTLFPNPS